jgi:serine/threonine-protein kinase
MPLILQNNYLPLELIGRGGFGKTFLAWDSNLKHNCVIKQLQPRNLSVNPLPSSVIEHIKQSFQREAIILRDLRHHQIPRLWNYFEIIAPFDSTETDISENRQKLFYLVQDYIEGENLAQIIQNKKFSENEVLKILQSILPILQYIHSQWVIHRDIKPANIILYNNEIPYLIDFGAVKQAVAGVPVEQSMVIGTADYAPPEQLSGKAVSYSSDLYSLAATCICLLTGRHPKGLRFEGTWTWHQYANVSNNFASILDKMLSPEPLHRFQSAAEVIVALQELQQPSQLSTNLPTINTGNTLNPNQASATTTTFNVSSFFNKIKRRLPKAPLLFVILGFISLAIALLINWWINQPICDFQNQIGFSCGEIVLFPKNPKITHDIFDVKQKATKEFKHGKFKESTQDFQKYLNLNQNDPEARIYLNNAKAALKRNPLKIAAAVPIIDDTFNTSNALAEQLLRGFAHVQDRINQGGGIDGQMLFIEIASYLGSTGRIKYVADNIASKKNILGVVGYYTSDNILEAAPSYDGKIVAISPTSTAVRDYNFRLNNYIFRTSPDNSAAASRLVAYMVDQKLKKTAIFYQPDDKYTTSFIKEFKNILYKNQGELVDECQVTHSATEALNCLQRAKQNKAEVILLAFSDKIANIVAVPIISQSQNITILNADTLYLESVTQANNPKLRVAVRWHRSNATNSNFVEESVKLWGTGDVSWRTAMSYDATMAIVEGLRRTQGNYTRHRLYEELKDPNFSVKGASAKLEFNDLGDRKPLPGIGILVKVENNRFVIDEANSK